MPPLHRFAVTGVVVALALLVLVGCTGSPAPPSPQRSPERSAEATASAEPVALADLPVRRLAVARAPFCSTVPDSLVTAALDLTAPDGSETGGSGAPQVVEDTDGDRVRLGGQERDVAHEHGCTWAAGGATARAWVAVPPVNRALARELGDSLVRAAGCAELSDAPAYGSRSVSVTCEADRGTRVVRAGVLGDAWLGCSLDGDRDASAQEVQRRSDAWCAGLLQAVSGAPAGSD